jgi:hypothetical protein
LTSLVQQIFGQLVEQKTNDPKFEVSNLAMGLAL